MNNDEPSRTGSPRPAAPTALAWLLFALLLLVAATVRRAGWENWSLWLDETMQVHYARQPLAEMQRTLILDGNHPPLDYLITKVVRRFSESDGALRTPALLWGVGTVAALFFGAGGFARPRRAFATGLAFAVLPAAVHYGQEVRPYSLALLLVAIAEWARQRASASDRSAWLAVQFAAAVLAAYTLYWALLALAIGWLVEATAAWSGRRRNRRRWHRALLLPAAVLLAWVPWLWALREHPPRPHEFAAPPLSVELVASYAAGLAVDREASQRWLAAGFVGLVAVTGLVALGGWERRRTAIELAANFALPLVVLTLAGHWWSLRYVLMASLPLARALGAGVDALAGAAPGRWRGAALPAYGLALLLCQAPALAANRLGGRPDWRPPARYLAEQFARGNGGTVHAVEGWGYFVMRFQLLRLTPPIPLVRILGTPEELRSGMALAGDGWIVRAPRFAPGAPVDALLAAQPPWATFPGAEDGALYRYEGGELVPPKPP